MKSMDDYHFAVERLARLAHDYIMREGQYGRYSPINVCGVLVTCADDYISVRNRFSQKLRSVPFVDIDEALKRYTPS